MGFDFLDFGFPRSGTDWKSINGKPDITISAKGRSNGLSTKINDGADFGPDTTLNATSPNQIGAPYTQTSGIQETINYVQSFWQQYPLGINMSLFPEIYLLNGPYVINDNTTIYIYNGPNGPATNGLHIHGPSHSPATCTIVKKNSLPSPILSFSNPRGSSPGGNNVITQMIFENFSVQYLGPASNATAGVTVVNLSVNETGGTQNVFRNLFISSANPINNIMLDVSGNEDAVIDNVQTNNAGGNYNSSITVASLKTHMPGGNVKIYNGIHSGVDIEAQVALLSGLAIGTGAGAGIIWRPAIYGATLSLNSVGFNGPLTRLITTQTPTSGTLVEGYILINGCLLTKTPVSSGDYMLDFSVVGTFLDIKSSTLFNNTPSDTLYLLNPSNINLIRFKGFNDLTDWPAVINNTTINVPTVSTPSLPASGTAQQNTYPYPVNVYLYGGTVTQITITKNGTPYTVFSNASGVALSGQLYKLGEDENITITYTGAPTWVWIRD